jgi:hypothetical protein
MGKRIPPSEHTAGAALRAGLRAPFLIAGALEGVYDVGVYLTFRAVASVASADNSGWSIYGAQRLRPAAIGGR